MSSLQGRNLENGKRSLDVTFQLQQLEPFFTLCFSLGIIQCDNTIRPQPSTSTFIGLTYLQALAGTIHYSFSVQHSVSIKLERHEDSRVGRPYSQRSTES